MRASDFEIKNFKKLDLILAKLCRLVVEGQETDPEAYGMVAAAVLDPENNMIARLNYAVPDGKHVHAERAAMDAYNKRYGEIPEGSIIITTLSPCYEPMHERVGSSCTEIINNSNVGKVYCGFDDPSQNSADDPRTFTLQETNLPELRQVCRKLADTFLNLDEGLEYKGYPCTVDCGGHMAGDEYAARWGIKDPNQCPYGNSNSFWEGCRSYGEEEQ